MDQSVGPRPVANSYTNARTNKLTLTHTQVKCFNSCQKTCKNPICLSFPSAEPRARRARHRAPRHPGRVAARPGGEAQPGKRSWGWTDRQRDRGMEAACGSFTVRRGDAPGPGALSAGRKPKREESEQSSLAHPSAERRGGGTRAEERHCGIGMAVSGAGCSRAPAPSPHAPTGSGA